MAFDASYEVAFTRSSGRLSIPSSSAHSLQLSAFAIAAAHAPLGAPGAIDALVDSLVATASRAPSDDPLLLPGLDYEEREAAKLAAETPAAALAALKRPAAAPIVAQLRSGDVDEQAEAAVALEH